MARATKHNKIMQTRKATASKTMYLALCSCGWTDTLWRNTRGLSEREFRLHISKATGTIRRVK